MADLGARPTRVWLRSRLRPATPGEDLPTRRPLRRRDELLAQLYVLGRVERPFFVAQQLETVLFEGIPLRLKTYKWWKRLGRLTARAETAAIYSHLGLVRGLDLLHSLLSRSLSDPDIPGHVMLVGDAGTGKTTLSRMLVRRFRDELNAEQPLVPVWVGLRRWDPTTTTPRELIVSLLGRDWNLSSLLAHQLIRDNGVLAIFDGLDELPPEKGPAALNALQREWQGKPMLITSRPSGLVYSTCRQSEVTPVTIKHPSP